MLCMRHCLRLGRSWFVALKLPLSHRIYFRSNLCFALFSTIEHFDQNIFPCTITRIHTRTERKLERESKICTSWHRQIQQNENSSRTNACCKMEYEKRRMFELEKNPPKILLNGEWYWNGYIVALALCSNFLTPIHKRDFFHSFGFFCLRFFFHCLHFFASTFFIEHNFSHSSILPFGCCCCHFASVWVNVYKCFFILTAPT